MRRPTVVTLGALRLSWACLSVTSVSAQEMPREDTAQLLTELIRIDTSNPPGHEARVAEFLAQRFRPLGFEVRILPTPEPEKAHFIARLRGDGRKRPVLLAAHAGR